MNLYRDDRTYIDIFSKTEVVFYLRLHLINLNKCLMKEVVKMGFCSSPLPL